MAMPDDTQFIKLHNFMVLREPLSTQDRYIEFLISYLYFFFRKKYKYVHNGAKMKRMRPSGT